MIKFQTPALQGGTSLGSTIFVKAVIYLMWYHTGSSGVSRPMIGVFTRRGEGGQTHSDEGRVRVGSGMVEMQPQAKGCRPLHGATGS